MVDNNLSEVVSIGGLILRVGDCSQAHKPCREGRGGEPGRCVGGLQRRIEGVPNALRLDQLGEPEALNPRFRYSPIKPRLRYLTPGSLTVLLDEFMGSPCITTGAGQAS